jgi:hypothetical protein
MAFYTTTPVSGRVLDTARPDGERPIHDVAPEGSYATRLIHWVAEARSHRVICLVLGIWLLNGFDLTFTILSHEQGLLLEENPLARHMLQYGTASIVLYKIGMVLIGSYPLLRFRRARITELGTYVIFAAYTLLAFRWGTCFKLFTATMTDNANFADIESLTGLGPR